ELWKRGRPNRLPRCRICDKWPCLGHRLFGWSALYVHVVEHTRVDVALRYPESLAVHRNALYPRLERVLVDPEDDRDVSNVFLNYLFGLLVNRQPLVRIRLSLALIH